MEKSQLKIKDHSFLSGEQAIEVWYEDQMIATVYGTEGPGVRVFSKHSMDIVRGGLGPNVGVIEVRIEPS